jgi:hypothetical protein
LTKLNTEKEKELNLKIEELKLNTEKERELNLNIKELKEKLNLLENFDANSQYASNHQKFAAGKPQLGVYPILATHPHPMLPNGAPESSTHSVHNIYNSGNEN